MKPKAIRPQSSGQTISHTPRRSMSTVSNTSHDSYQAALDPSFAGNDGYAAVSAGSTDQLHQPSSEDVAAALQSFAESSKQQAPSAVQQQQQQQHVLPHQQPPIDAYYRYNLAQGTSIDPQLPPHELARRYGSFDQPDASQASIYPPPDAAQTHPYLAPQPAERMQQPSHAPTNSTDIERKEKKPSNTSAANEKELRELLDKNQGRSLESVARDVKSAERTAKSEKAKQLFAMRWLQEYCKQDKESVPRNRVYTHYAQRCGTDRVDTLNPASFGKLVRVIFPGIQTRRLGVRGESKYHYVNLTLKEDPHAMFSQRPSSSHAFARQADRTASVEPDFDFSTMSRIPMDTAAFPQDQALDRPGVLMDSNPQSKGSLFAEPNAVEFRPTSSRSHMYAQPLKFSSSNESTLQDEPMTLPNVHQFVPAKTDVDVADALSALYRTHCTSLVDSVRFVKEKQFVRLLGSFNGTLTVPVSKLFSHPNMAPWIKACDWLMYQQIIRFVSQLALQVIPPQVFQMLGNVSFQLADHIKKNFSHYPAHVLEAKLEPATIFSSLLQRLLRVNETAHAAANLLIVDQNRDLMWQDWVKGVRAKRVIESELPNCGYAEVYHILTAEVRTLLEPLTPSQLPEFGTEYQFAASMTPTEPVAPSDISSTTAEGVLDRWTSFLKALPSRFPHATTRTLLHCIGAVGTAAMRDITVNQAQSFGGWWVTKVWVDEMVHWLAEMGGFLDSQPSMPVASPHISDTFESNYDISTIDGRQGDQNAGLGIDFAAPNSDSRAASQGRRSKSPSKGNFHTTSKANGQRSSLRHEFVHDAADDSGIGMSLLDDDLQNMKYDFSNVHDAVHSDILVR